MKNTDDWDAGGNWTPGQSDRPAPNKDPAQTSSSDTWSRSKPTNTLACPFPFISSFSVTFIITKNCIKNRLQNSNMP